MQRIGSNFGCPAIRMEDFGNQVIEKDLGKLTIDTSDWDEKIKPFMTKSVEKSTLIVFGYFSKIGQKHYC